MNLLWSGILLVLLFWLLSRGSLYLHIDYIKTAYQDRLEYKIYLFDYLRLYQKRQDDFVANLLKTQQAKIWGIHAELTNKTPANFFTKLRQIDYLPKIASVSGEKLQGTICFGNGNPGETAIMFGVGQIIQVGLLRYLRRRLTFTSPPRIILVPDFQAVRNEIAVQCIVRVRIGYLICMFKKLL